MNNIWIKRLLSLLLVSVLFLSFNDGENIFAERATIDVTLHTYFDSENIVETTGLSGPYGTTLSFETDVASQSNYSFAYWIVNDAVEESYLVDHEFILTAGISLIAVFSPDDEYAGIFRDSNLELLAIKYTDNPIFLLDDSDVPQPDKPGYAVDDPKWDEVLTLSTNTILTLQYTFATSDVYDITVTGGVSLGPVADIPFDTVLAVQANDPDSGEYFQYWEVDGEIVSYNTLYQFTVLEDKTLTAVFDTVVQTPEPVVSMSDELALRSGYISFIGQMYIPDGFTLVEYGILTATTQRVPTLDDGTSRIVQGSTYLSSTYEYLMSFSADISSIRSYMVLDNGIDEPVVFYSSVYNVTLYTVGEEKFNYQFDVEDSGTLALPNLVEGSGYYVNNGGYAETVSSLAPVVFGEADAWTSVSDGYDKGMEEFVIETKVTALGHTNTDESPIFTVRVQYDWLMDIHFNFNNNSWSGVAVYNANGGTIYSNNEASGGLAPNLVLDLNTEYIFKVVVTSSDVSGEDTLRIYVDEVLVIEANVQNVNLNARHMMGASAGSHIKVDYFKGNLVELVNPPLYGVGEEKFNYQFDVEDSGTLALPNLVEGSGYYVNNGGYAETVSSLAPVVFGEADAWTSVSDGYDKGMEEFVIETKVTALGHTNTDESPIFTVRVQYDWLMDIHFNFNNNSWSGVAVYNANGGTIYSNNEASGGLAPNLVLDLNTEYIFKVVVTSSDVSGEDTLRIYVDEVLVIEANVQNVNLNARHMMGASAGSHIKVDYFKGNLIEVY